MAFHHQKLEARGRRAGLSSFVYTAGFFDHAALFVLIVPVRAEPTEMYVLSRAGGEKTRRWTARKTEALIVRVLLVVETESGLWVQG